MIPWDDYPHLDAARRRSETLLARIGERLAELAARAPDVRTVAVSGSLGRLEAQAHSDCDLVVIVSDGAGPQRARAAMAAVWERLEPLRLTRPVSTGIYVHPATAAALCDAATRGKVADDVDAFGKRMQVLLDSRPVYGNAAFADLQRGVVARYASGFLERGPDKEWSFLLNDLKRYFASYCAAKQWDFTRDNGGWYLRSIKLRHSRVLMYAALLFLLGECSKHAADKPGWLLEHLALTPLERVAAVYRYNGDPGFDRVARRYDRFIEMLGDAAARAPLLAGAPARVEAIAPERFPVYGAMRENAAALTDELLRFVLARRDDWSARFYRYLLF